MQVNTTDKSDDGASPSRPVWLMSALGIAPLVFFTIALLLVGRQSALVAPLADAFKTCAAIILSFQAGIHWGILLGKSNSTLGPGSVLAAFAPPAIGWIALFISEPMCFAFLMVGFAAQGAWDNFAAHHGLLPRWFSKIRMILTIIMVAILAVAMFATA